MKEKAKDKRKYKGARNKKWQPRDKEAPSTNELTGHNDFNWYNLNKELVEMSARVPFGRPLGNTITLGINSRTSANTWSHYNTHSAIPGIMTFYMVPSIGCSNEGVQPIDVASKSIYSFVRHANSGHTNYDSPDLMLYLLSAREIYAAGGYLLKVYGAINKYDATNRYFPEILLRTLNIDPDFARRNQADIRYYCAQFFRKAASIYTPKSLPLFQKAFWMYTQIYEEDKTGKSGLYQYAPSGFHKFNPTKYTTGGCLEWVKMPASITTMAQFTAYFDALLDPIISDEDMGIMSGDIKKAFGDNIWNLGEFPYDYTLETVRDSFVLQQMHNTRGMSIYGTPSKLDIVQDNSTNELLFFPCATLTNGHEYAIMDVRGEGHILDIDSQVPSAEEVIEATQYLNSWFIKTSATTGRLLTYLSITNGSYTNDVSLVVTNAGDFICDYITMAQKTSTSWTSETITNKENCVLDSNWTIASCYKVLTWATTFTFAPIFTMGYDVPFIGNLHNYTVINTDILDNLHETTWMSLLAIPAQAHLR